MTKPFPTATHSAARAGWTKHLASAAGGCVIVLAVVGPLWAYRYWMIELPPMVGDDVGVTARNRAVEITVLMNDADPVGFVDPKTVTIEQPPRHGQAIPNQQTGVVTYMPNADFDGQDVFMYAVRNQEGARSSPATVTVTVVP